MTPATIVAGGSYGAREAAVADLLMHSLGMRSPEPRPAAAQSADAPVPIPPAVAVRTAGPRIAGPASIILEGLPDGRDLLSTLTLSAAPRVARMPPGCPCCAGNLVMRVTLNRLLRPAPAHLFVAIADPAHVPALRAFLASEQYTGLLALQDDIVLEGTSATS
jgi:hypothetical protein